MEEDGKAIECFEEWLGSELVYALAQAQGEDEYVKDTKEEGGEHEEPTDRRRGLEQSHLGEEEMI